ITSRRSSRCPNRSASIGHSGTARTTTPPRPGGVWPRRGLTWQNPLRSKHPAMYLSAARQSAIQQTARSNSVEGTPEELVKDALEAITYCDATDAAYSVAEAAGCYELVPGVWYRKENELDATQARAILTQAKADQTYEAPIPEDDAKAVEEATSLVEMAQTAWNQYVRGPEV